MRTPVIATIAVLALVGVACGKASPRLASSGSPSPAGPSTGYQALTNDKTPGSKEPVVTIPDQAPPTTLQVTDLTVGTGAAAQATSNVTVNYLLITWEDKKKVDGSFGGQPLTSPLSNLIQGWKDAIPGMKIGGRRQIVIPPDLGYGPAGNGHPLGGKTLVFIIDLLNVS